MKVSKGVSIPMNVKRTFRQITDKKLKYFSSISDYIIAWTTIALKVYFAVLVLRATGARFVARKAPGVTTFAGDMNLTRM